MILIFLLPHDALFWLYNVYMIGKRAAKGLLTVVFTIFLFSLTLPMCFFSKEVRQCSQVCSLTECSGMNRSETG